ncbi:male sterility protein-domain-containing protein [Xylariaceae sp. FL0804]|nr:male sterility protein-domain-containing protein [Xylariaceae sp. FL0804]
MADAVQPECPAVPGQTFWAKEVDISGDPGNDVPSQPSLVRPARQRQVLVLTGATGFLGRELLRQLISSNDVSTIHCIAVRQPHGRLDGPFLQPRVRVHQGDLTAKQLGLSDEDASKIVNQADAVLHVGADVSFLRSYESLMRANVVSTKELVRLDLPQLLPLHFISSATVIRLS